MEVIYSKWSIMIYHRVEINMLQMSFLLANDFQISPLYRRGADCKPLDSEDTKCLLYTVHEKRIINIIVNIYKIN